MQCLPAPHMTFPAGDGASPGSPVQGAQVEAEHGKEVCEGGGKIQSGPGVAKHCEAAGC